MQVLYLQGVTGVDWGEIKNHFLTQFRKTFSDLRRKILNSPPDIQTRDRNIVLFLQTA